MEQLTDHQLIEELKKRFGQNQKTIDELELLTKELRHVNKKLEESEALKSHFISNITNEIMNPFTSIMGLSKNILSVKKEDWKRVITMVAMIHSEAFNLDFQLRNIFVAAKIEAGEISPEVMNTDLVKLVQYAVESFRTEANKKNLKLITKFTNGKGVISKGLFNTDPEKIHLILANLLSNAIKFSIDKGTIEINVIVKDKNATFIVKDYGTGISESNQRIIFDRFKRLDSGINSINRGHGLGLSINKAVIDMLGGEIKIDSTIGKGAEFIVTIPKALTQSSGFSELGNDVFFGDQEVL